MSDLAPRNIDVRIDCVDIKEPYTLLANLYFKLDNGEEYTVPEGFYTDFGSVPRVLWNIISPWDKRFLMAYVLHDWLYKTGITKRLKADDILLQLSKRYGANIITRNLVYRGVRAGGFVAWNSHRNNKDKEEVYIDG